MRKAIKVLSLLLAIAMIFGTLAACGEKEPDVGAKSDQLRVALILPGKADDLSFNQSMYEGVKTVAAEYGDRIDLKIVEEVYEVADIEPALMDFASEGYDVIFGHGFQFMEPIMKVAEKYPDTMFCLGTGYKTLTNTCVYDVHLQDGGYLMGVFAASMSETGKIGVIGGADVSEIYRGHEAYKFGARSVNPDIEIQEVYTGDWTDSAGAKEAAISMYDSGVDIIWHSGDGIGLGAVEAAKEKNKWVLGNVADQNVLAPDNVVSGVVYEWKSIIRQIFEDILNDNFTNREDKFYWITAENGGLTYAPILDAASQETKDLVEQTFKLLKSESVEMPDFDADKG